MGRHLHPGDNCPWCGEELEYLLPTLRTLFLRESRLRCSSCDFVARKRRVYLDAPSAFPKERTF